MSLISRRIGAACAALITAVGLFAAPTAQAQDLNELSSTLPFDIESEADKISQQVEDTAWSARNDAQRAVRVIDQVDPNLTKQFSAGIDEAIEVVYPGIIERRTPRATPAPRPQAVVKQAAKAPAFDYGSCPADAKVCVDIAGQRSWLQNNGQVYYGAVRVSTGRVGQETPRGTFYVNRQVRDEISYEFNNAPMPFATYFTNYGHAFHEGTPDNMSAGCVRMYRADAEKYFNDLNIGDKVYIY
ncbi:L,D-transpeptidase [Corynebacterium lubricantis]|uniref:L,D-transpeptidase n=1 Tax=Corynebacterium lubricantis TaxID=541095 RepID=UPI00037C4D58|nr:L,D-transpeptidase [Corynebacterium lubricantis]